MSRKFKVWLDSGANHCSDYTQIIHLSDLGISDEDWDLISEEEQEEVMKDVAWERMDWGFVEIENDN